MPGKIIDISTSVVKTAFTIVGAITIVILLWYGSKPLANEEKIIDIKKCVNSLEIEVENNTEKVEKVGEKLEEIKDSVIRTEEKIKYLYMRAKEERDG